MLPPPAHGGARFTRTLNAVQIVGAIMAIPAALGSAYSMYRTNFSADTTCQSLRANIIQILDKAVDASARHMLVRRDVVAFEQACGSVDPDAAAAFKTLLSMDKSAATATPIRRVEVQPAPAEKQTVAKRDLKPEAKPEAKAETKSEAKPDLKVEAKAEPKVDVKLEAKTEAKPTETKATAKPSAVAAVPAQRDAAVPSDTAWLDAVRGALVNHSADASPPGDIVEPQVDARPIEATAALSRTAEPRSAETKQPFTAPLMRQAVHDAPPMSLENVRVPPLMTMTTAAPLPAPVAVASAPAPQADDGHPVPPGAIPDAAPPSGRDGHSRIGALMSHIPFVGGALGR